MRRAQIQHRMVVGLRTAKAVCGDQVVVVKRRQCSGNDVQTFFVGVDGAGMQGVQVVVVECSFPLPLVAFGEINAKDEIGRFQTGTTQTLCDFVQRVVVVWNGRPRTVRVEMCRGLFELFAGGGTGSGWAARGFGSGGVAHGVGVE